tara:strand:+ start:1297 stop:2199 length:903 start_codon:yes stop_codon:yes gene_type:complete
MPNWCINRLTISDTECINSSEIERFIYENKPINCKLLNESCKKHNEKVKVEKEKKLKNNNYLIDFNYSEEIIINEEEPLTFWGTCPRPEEEENNWFSWNNNNWGTKWDISDVQIIEKNNNMVILDFDTAWSPPLAWLEKTANIYNKLKFEIEYEESGNDFWGNSIYINGELYSEDNSPLSDRMFSKFCEKKEQYIEEIYHALFKNNIDKLKEISDSKNDNCIGIPDNIYDEISEYCNDIGFYYDNVIEYVLSEMKEFCQKKYNKIIIEENLKIKHVLAYLIKKGKINEDTSNYIMKKYWL